MFDSFISFQNVKIYWHPPKVTNTIKKISTHSLIFKLGVLSHLLLLLNAKIVFSLWGTPLNWLKFF